MAGFWERFSLPIPPREIISKRWENAEEVEQAVKQLVSEELRVPLDKVTPESDWYRDFGCSLNVVEIFMRCEEDFGLEMSEEDMSECETVGKLIDYLNRKLGLA